MNPITLARQAIIARLQTITTANGYLTDAGQSVHFGWLKEVIEDAQAAYPMIVLQPAKSEEKVENRAGTLVIPLAFHVVGAVDGVGYEEALDDLTIDLCRCLAPQDGIAASWRSDGLIWRAALAAPDFYPPGDGLNAGTVLIAAQTKVAFELPT